MVIFLVKKMNLVYLQSPFNNALDNKGDLIIISQNNLSFFGFPYIASKLQNYKQAIKIADCSQDICNSLLANNYNFDYIIVDVNDAMLSKLNTLNKQQKFFKNLKQLTKYLDSEKVWRFQATL